MKTPTYNAFVQFLFENNIIDWNPTLHEDWELPPSQCISWYFDIFPLHNVKKEHVVGHVTKKCSQLILKYFKEIGE